MKKKVFLHIGFHKTGSTSIQMFLFEHQEQLKHAGYLYPKSGMPPGSLGQHSLAWDIRKGSQKSWHRLLDEIQASDAPNVIISSEDFEQLNKQQCSEVLHLLDDFEIHIVVYIREPEKLLLSAYKGNVKAGRISQSFTDFSRQSIRRCDFPALIRKWRFVYRMNDHFIVRSFDQAIHHKGLITDFLGIVDSKLQQEFPNPDTFHANASPPNATIRVLRRCNALLEKLHPKNPIHKLMYRARNSIAMQDRFSRYWLFLLGKTLTDDSHLATEKDLKYIRNNSQEWYKTAITSFNINAPESSKS